MCNAYNHPPGCRCGWGGEGSLGGGGRSYSDIYSPLNLRDTYSYSSGHSYGESRTSQRKCWWCGELVYFHTNGYGDFVMFDELGAPWQVHECWEEHRNERRNPSHRFGEVSLTPTDRNFYKSSGERINAPSSKIETNVSVTGFVMENYGLHSKPLFTRFSIGSNFRPSSWVEVDVFSNQKIYSFWIPRSRVDGIEDYSIVKFEGKWIRWRNEWFLLTTKVSHIRYPISTWTTIKIVDFTTPLCCYYCGRKIVNGVKWGIDNVLRIQCEICSNKPHR